MEEFYHFSHFFEFLCGVYFGGFALLSFLEADALARFESLIQQKSDRASRCVMLSEQYFKLHTTSPKDGKFKYLFFGTCWFIYSLLDWVFNIFFKISRLFITKIGTSKDKDFLKKFFPSFFFAGCFCLMMVLLTGFQQGNTNAICYNAVDYFLIYYGLSCIIFQFWALIIFPFLVNVFDYFHLTFFNILLCGALFALSVIYSKNQISYFNLNWFLRDGKDWLKICILVIALFPLLFILSISIVTIAFWEMSVIFYSVSNFFFEMQKDNIKENINEIVNPEKRTKKDHIKLFWYIIWAIALLILGSLTAHILK